MDNNNYFKIFKIDNKNNNFEISLLNNNNKEIINNNYKYFNKINYKLLFNNNSINENNSINVNNINNFTEVNIYIDKIYTFNISIIFNLTYIKDICYFYVKLDNKYIKKFSLLPIKYNNINQSESLNASFLLKLYNGNKITFESNYKLIEGFLDIIF
jgi:hypothetical protein